MANGWRKNAIVGFAETEMGEEELQRIIFQSHGPENWALKQLKGDIDELRAAVSAALFAWRFSDEATECEAMDALAEAAGVDVGGPLEPPKTVTGATLPGSRKPHEGSSNG